MPWSNQNGGGWKSGGGRGEGPWGQGPSGPSGPGQQPPDIEEILKKGQDRLKQAMPGGGANKSFMFLVSAIALAAITFYGFTIRVNPDEVGVVLRFGKFHDQLPPGLNFRAPYPIDKIYLPKVTRVNQTEVGFRAASTSRGFRPGGRDVPKESLMLTGDENIVDVDFVVFWQIKDAREFLFNIQNPVKTVKEVAESAMRDIVGRSDIEPILTEERAKTELAVLDLMQKTLDNYKAGIKITQVQMQKVDPPGEVIGAFRDVQAARADQVRLQNEAEKFAERVIPEARGEAQRILQEAEAYREQTIAQSVGEADRFIKVYNEYKKAPEVTRKRLFLETMEKVLGRSDKIIIDGSGGGTGVVPYLPLNELSRKSGGGR